MQTDDEGFDVVARKLADLTLGEVVAPKQVGRTAADVMQQATLKGGPWQDAYGAHAVGMCVWVGRQPCWQSSHQIDRIGLGESEVCGDQFWPVVEGGGSA